MRRMEDCSRGMAKYLVGAGADIHAKDNAGETPLHHAAWKDAVEAANVSV